MSELRLTSLTTHTIRGEVYEVPLDEVLAIGVGLSAAAAAGLAAITLIRQAKLKQQEEAEESPESKILKLQAMSPVIESLSKLSGDTLDGVAGIVKESLTVGSILPDEI